MSDIRIDLPPWLLLILIGSQIWPVFLVAFGLTLGVGLVWRGIARAAAFVMAALLAAYLAAMAVVFLR